MNTYLVTATFKNVALMGAAYDLRPLEQHF